MVKYLHDVASKYQIVDKIQCNVEVQEMRYLKDEELWEATLLHLAPGTGDMGAKQREQYIAKNGRQSVYLREEKVKAKIIISGVGGLVEPKEWPDHIPGRENFKGELFHTARWRDDVDLNGKDVVVVGTGCSAAQVVPGILEEPYNVKSVTQIMRSPPWVVPKPPEPFGKEKFAKNAPKIIGRIPGLGHTIRTLMFWISESDWFRIFGTKQFHENQRKGVEARLMKHMNRVVPEKYHEMMTPNYSLACKRRIFDADWFKSMNNERFHLTTQVLKRIEPDGITLAGAQTYPPGENKGAGEDVHLPADVIILANGFDLTQWLYPLRVYGDKGQSIHDVWDQRGGPQAYLGTAMDGFPNFFILFGPNTATGHSSVVFAIECAVMHTLKMIAPILRGDASTVEVKKEAEIKWTNDIQRQLKDTVFMSGGCTSWYYTANGWNATGYPFVIPISLTVLPLNSTLLTIHEVVHR